MKTGLGLMRRARTIINTIKATGKPKIFCIGLNKTGTTSLEKAMREMGFIGGNQGKAMKMIDLWAKRDFKPIINFCKTAQFFQDIPFSFPYTFIAIDQAFPKSKFILTVRNNAEEWYSSLIRFHGKLWGNGNIPISSEDLKKAPGPWPGYRFHVRMMVNNVPKNEPYKKDVLIDYYETHNKNVMDYFRHRKEDLLVINLKCSQDYSRFCDFLGCKQERDGFPWENRT